MIWTIPGPALTAATGFLAADPLVTGRLWVTTGQTNGTWRLDNAHSGTLQTTQFTTPLNPGPVAVKPGTSHVYVAGRVVLQGQSAELWRCLAPCTAASWEMLGTDFYRASSAFPSNLTLAADAPGFAYVPTAGQGVVINTAV